MIKLRIEQLLQEQGKSKYWLVKKLESNYTVINRMLANETTSISFETLDKLCEVFHCQPGDLFTR